MNKKFIIGVTGTHASGKDALALYMLNTYGIKSYSTSDEVRREASKQGLELTRENLFIVANQIRESQGNGELAKRALDRAEDKVSLITGIRNLGEIEYLKKHSHFYLISVDAPIELRYKRSLARDRTGDKKDFEKFKFEEEKEINVGQAGQQLIPCMRMADYFIINDGTIEDLYRRIEEIMKAIMVLINNQMNRGEALGPAEK